MKFISRLENIQPRFNIARIIVYIIPDTLATRPWPRSPNNPPPTKYSNTWLGRAPAVPRPNESHFRQQQLSDHTIFVFSIWHGCVGIYRGTGRGEGGEGGAADILFTTIHGGERSSLRGPCTVTTTRKEVDIIPTYDGSYRWHSMARGLRAALCLVILIFKLPTVLLCGVFHLARLPFPCLSVALIRVETTVHGD